ncbi:lipopolysaccharide core heptose(II) kinase RfaY [Enterobacteriaceae bacterium BIT-l23]|jgi:heptose II phosphotransferase|uniref:lipopolysaccharide core heptose(II) kinase RfaY n=1 Tax=Jejubacter sp. L23 TaxID=3092086 RepID=UPI0015847E49|nr:lipopolysaccharide core heptose(II) kinase RfaY [Enterobacteriaceae bacterium BIT-l23]
MVHSLNINNYYVLTKDSDGRYEEILRDIFKYNISIIKVFRNIEDTKVLLISTKYGKFILKFFAPKMKQKERFAKSMLKGDYYENLFRQTERVRNEGVHSVNDFYLLAEKKTLRFVHHYIMLIEYIDGIELADINPIDDELKSKINTSIIELHQHGMVSGDPHKGNFIVANNEVRIIDLSGKRCTAGRRAKDRIDLERHFGIYNKTKDLGFYILIYKKKLRNFIRKLKGKEVR